MEPDSIHFRIQLAITYRPFMHSRLLTLPGTPSVVFGQIDVPGAQHTIVFYAHYDGQPVTPAEWDGGSPFAPASRLAGGAPGQPDTAFAELCEEQAGIALQICRIGGNVRYRQQFAKLLYEFSPMSRDVVASSLRRRLRRNRGCQTKEKRSKTGSLGIGLMVSLIQLHLSKCSSLRSCWMHCNFRAQLSRFQQAMEPRLSGKPLLVESDCTSSSGKVAQATTLIGKMHYLRTSLQDRPIPATACQKPTHGQSAESLPRQL
jgi:hypothetical protein